MKKLYALLFFAFISTFLLAQTSGGPDLFGYTWKNSDDPVNPPSFQWYDISTIGTQVTGLGDDNFVGPFSIPGGFTYYYYTVNTFWIGSNGYVTFNGDNISSPFPAFIPLATGAQNFLAMNLSDLNFAGVGNPAKCYYHVKGDSIVVSFHDVPYWSVNAPTYTGSNTFQVILNKADSSITYNFLDMNLGTVTGLDNAVGIENNNGTIGLQTLIDQSPADSLTVVYTYPPVVTYSVIDAGMNWNGNDANGGIFIKRRGDSLSLKANVKNYGNSALGSMTVDNQVLNAIGAPQTSGNISLSSLAVGKDSTLNFPNKFYANAAGIYSFRTTVTATGDAVNTNDVTEQKLVAIDTTKNLMVLDYSDELPDGAGLGWNGGGGGIAIYIEPPMYPVKIKSTRFYISANTGSAGFHAMIYDDDGPGGGPGTLLDSAYRAGFSVSVNNYNTVPTTNNNILISNGGVYLLWLMDGANINLGRDINPPISRRTYEVLGGSWSTYRDFQTEDFLMGLNVSSVIPKANFSADASMDPLVDFTDLSSNSPDKWKWTFGDGSPIDTTQNPSHTYASIDTFEVCLTVSNFAGTDSICKNIEIKNIPPVADFAISTTNMPTIAFSDLSSNDPNKWHWDFGDGDTSNVKNVTHRYLKNDTFLVCLTAWNQAGPDDTCKEVIISGIGIGIAENSNEVFLNVYPNPSNSLAYIELPERGDVNKIKFNLFDMSGRQVELDYQVVNNRISFNAANLSNGTYLFEVANGEEKIGKGRFMVKK